MTREEILALPTGKKLDALVADKVMGWEAKPGRAYYWTGKDRVVRSVFYQFSTDISAAWEAEEKIKQLRLHVKYCEALKKVVLSTGEYVGLFDYIHATPAQRCKAALLAVMDKETKAK